VPVVASRVDCIPEVVPAGKAGLLRSSECVRAAVNGRAQERSHCGYVGCIRGCCS